MAQTIDGIEYLDGDEVAELLGVKKATLYAYVSRGMLRSYRQAVGRRRFYRRDEVERLRAVRPDTTSEDSDWELPDEEPPKQKGSLPDVTTWAGDH